MNCIYCGNTMESMPGVDFIVEDGNIAYHKTCPDIHRAKQLSDYEERLKRSIVDEAIHWYVNHQYDELETPYEEILREARTRTPFFA